MSRSRESIRRGQLTHSPSWKRRQRERVAMRSALLEADPHCHYCRRQLTAKTATLDHKLPKCDRRRDGIENMLLACLTCNRAKGWLPYSHMMKAVKVAEKVYGKNPTADQIAWARRRMFPMSRKPE